MSQARAISNPPPAAKPFNRRDDGFVEIEHLGDAGKTAVHLQLLELPSGGRFQIPAGAEKNARYR